MPQADGEADEDEEEARRAGAAVEAEEAFGFALRRPLVVLLARYGQRGARALLVRRLRHGPVGHAFEVVLPSGH